MTNPSDSLAKALERARGWVVTASESRVARDDLKAIDAALSAYREDRGGAEEEDWVTVRRSQLMILANPDRYRITSGSPDRFYTEGYAHAGASVRKAIEALLADAPPPQPTQEGGWRAISEEDREYLVDLLEDGLIDLGLLDRHPRKDPEQHAARRRAFVARNEQIQRILASLPPAPQPKEGAK